MQFDDSRGVQFNDTVTTEVQSMYAMMALNLSKTLRSDDSESSYDCLSQNAKGYHWDWLVVCFTITLHYLSASG